MPDSLVFTSIFTNEPETRRNTEANGKLLSNGLQIPTVSHFDKCTSMKLRDTHQKALQACLKLRKKQGIHTSITMESAGFRYTNHGDITRCDTCGLEVSGWTSDMKPFTIHSQRSPTCPFVLSMFPSRNTTTNVTTSLIQTTSMLNDEKQPLKRLKTDTIVANLLPNKLVEVNTLKQVRKRSFSHWPHRSSPSSSQMIEAGFFNCNVGDRVICIYCNIICQQWTPNSDDPSEIHKILSPNCSYVLAILIRSQTSSISIINETSGSADPFRCHEIVYTAACNTNYIEIPKRYASFGTWPNENLPPVDDLVRAGFFFTGTKTIVTCFYCNGSLQNWGPNDNPTIEHARWFPNCAYAKQLCGAELYRKIQESKRAQQERVKTTDSSNQSGVNAGNLNNGHLLIPDESTLSRLVAARLDLPISQSLLNRNFKLSVIKRCWEDQLRLKHEDFASDSDLLVACMVLQKQIELINGKKENIIVPSVAMKKIREKELASRINVEVSAHEQAVSGSLSTISSDDNDVDMTTSSTESNTREMSTIASISDKKEMKNATQSYSNTSSPTNPCVLCLEEEKRLACIPCGHLATCVPCGHSLRSCPICRRSIDAFMRIYL